MTDPNGDRLAAPVRRQRERTERGAREGERPLGRNLAMIGALGWLIVIPTLLGVLLGHWLDGLGEGRHGIAWTLSLTFWGLAIGCWLAWKRIEQE